MKRAMYVGLGTIAGVTAVLGYHPGTLFGTATAQATTPRATTAANGTASSGGTFTGDAVSTQYGTVQVEVAVSGGAVSAVTALSAPANDPHSSQISAAVIPQLEQQAVAAQSARIDGVSGASYTSAGFEQSLQSALVKAGLA